MATTTNITVSITAVTANFAKGMGRAATTVKKFTGAIAGTIGKVGVLGGAIAGLAGAAGLGAMLKSSYETIDALAKTSDRLGIATEKLAGFHHAAGLAGGSTDAVDKGIAKMGRSIADASNGLGKAVDSFNTLGLSTSTLLGMSPDQQFVTIAEALKGVENQTIRNSLAFDIFGRSSEDLMNTLALGGPGLEAAVAEAEKLGLAVNRVDAAKIEMANDAITKMKGAITGVVNQLAIKLAPSITIVTEKFVDWTTSVDFSGMIRGSGWLAESIAKVADVVQVLQAAWYTVQGVIIKSVQVTSKPLEYLLRIIAKGIELTTGFDTGVSDFFAAMNEGFSKAADDAFEQANKIWTGPNASDGVKKWLADMDKEIDARAKSIADTASSRMVTEFDESLLKMEEKAKKAKEPATLKDVRLPSLAEAGTRSAFDALRSFDRKSLSDMINENILAEQKKQTALLQKVAETAGPPQLVDVPL